MKNVGGIRPEFSYSKRDEIKSQLIQQATNNAKQKALNLATGMSVKLGAVYAVSQDFDFSGVDAIFTYSRGGEGMRSADFVSPPSFDFAPDSQGSTAMMFVPRFLEIRTSVSAIYRIQ
jgi:hypothetical protein